MVSCEFCEIYKNTFFTEHLWKTASAGWKAFISEVHDMVELGLSFVPAVFIFDFNKHNKYNLKKEMKMQTRNEANLQK